MSEIWQIISQSYQSYWNYLVNEILQPSWHNYFYALIVISLICWALEIIIPWRKGQSMFRQDFWLDGFYMFFNYFLFSLVLYNALSNVVVHFFNGALASIGIENLVAIKVNSLPAWSQLLIMFILNDFIQWNVHRWLHANPRLWEFHKVHHSVKEMGFAAHLRFHWMERIIYNSVAFIPLSMIGFGIDDFFIIHILSTAIGHLNHSNLNWDYGIFKYIFNNPKMHIWHHAKYLPDGSNGVNFGISLSIWDYIFKKDYIPSEGRDIELGFEGDEQFPKDFIGQNLHY
jgi:sterol desaturase/sphingolipid hydroxylase (fatty acid hydroxylase superfamily)